MAGVAGRIPWLGGLVSRRGEGRATGATSADIKVPRVVFLVASLGLLLFGLLMIYSASSIVGLTTADYGFNPAYFVVRQAEFAVAGVVLAIVLARVDYHVWDGSLLKGVWAAMVVLLVVVFTPLAGRDAYGATRWIAIGPFTLQPSEFAKVIIVAVAAQIIRGHYYEGTIDGEQARRLALGGIGLPLLLVLAQPDKGTTGVIVLTLFVMCYLAGLPLTSLCAAGLVVGVAAIGWSLKDEYSRARIMTMLDPENDPYGAGYQLMQGFYAFGSGGLTGLGLGMSRQKYNYLPMAHNDFIFAIVGEELGLVGTVGMLVAFAVLLWAGLKIAENAPDVTGRLIAAGCTSLIIIQLLLNVAGVLGVFPLTGKPVPFVSYGGSSIISSLLLVGLVMSVSLRSAVPESSYERRRRQMRLADTQDLAEEWDPSEGSVGEPVGRRSMGPSRGAARVPSLRPGWSLVEGGRAQAVHWETARGSEAVTTRSSMSSPASRRSVGSASLVGGYQRIDLGPSPSERLRQRQD